MSLMQNSSKLWKSKSWAPWEPRWPASTGRQGRTRSLPVLLAGGLAGVPMIGLPLIFTMPAPAAAQVKAPAELVGTWVRTAWWADSAAVLRPVEMIYIFRADGTASLSSRDKWGEKTDKDIVRWGVKGDTLMTLVKWAAASKAEAQANADQLVITTQGDSMRVRDHGRFVRDGDQLLFGRLPDFTCADTLRRTDAFKPMPPLPTSPPGAFTVDRAALIGTWVGVSFVPGDTTVKSWDITTDTLTLRADSTSTISWLDLSHKRQTVTSPWQLYPGNILVDARGHASVIRSLKDDVLTLTMSYTNPCNPEWVYRRVGP